MNGDRRRLFPVFWRSFFLPSLTTLQRGQSVGFLFGLWPILDDLHREPAARAEAAEPHAGFFSTHPYLASVIWGVVAGLETDRAQGRGPSAETVVAARGAMAGPLAALGEAFFWSAWRPFCLTATAAACAFADAGPWAAVAVFLGTFHAVHLVVRWKGLRWGYALRTEVVPRLAALRLQRVFFLVGALGLAGLALLAAGEFSLDRRALSAAGGFAFFVAVIRRRVPVWVLFLASAAVVGAATFFQGATG